MDDTGAVLFTTAITVGLAAAAGFGVYRLTSPKGEVKNPSDCGRKWFAWTAMIVCITMLPKFFRSFDMESFFTWVTLFIAYGGLAFVMGWAYGKFYKFKTPTSANITLLDADAPSLTPPLEPSATSIEAIKQNIARPDEPQDAQPVSKEGEAGKSKSQDDLLGSIKVPLLAAIIIITVFLLYKIYPTEFHSSYSAETDNNGSEESTKNDPLETREQATLESESKLEKWKKEASAGDTAAIKILDMLYYLGVWIPQDSVEAVKCFRFAADQGYAVAQFLLGDMYLKGNGLPRDTVEAVRWYQLAADQGNAMAQISLGVMYCNGDGVLQDYSEAIRLYRLAADQGKAIAQFNLGVMYCNGDGVPQNYSEAVRWYQLAADQGYASAQLRLGVIYNYGFGVPQDYEKAKKWFLLAADQGYDMAKYNLGRMYYNGRGILQDYIKAHMWLNLAASNGNQSASKLRDVVAQKMTPAQISEAQRLASKWYEKHSKSN